ncbi:type VI secretion system contractile sheath protein TssC [Chryseobacterium indoltheticum]|uniref:type VI secretion system contractile sheath protein TssC n=1 Tax=Chryseobacterium indoltheticum TaxID=254 RepID=UPI003F49360E
MDSKLQAAESQQHNQQQQTGRPKGNPLEELNKIGGFGFIESVVDGIANMNPTRKARKEIFLNDGNKTDERKELLQKINLRVELLNSNDSAEKMADTCKNKAQAADQNLKVNLKNSLDAVRQLETSYRTVAQFYKNTELDKVDNVSIVNASLDQVSDLDNPIFIDAIAEEFKNYYDRLDLRDNYSILAIPGYLGSNKVVEKWAKICNENKVMMVTDFANLDKPDDVVDLFHSANLTGGELHRSNVIMTCNWLVGRGRAEEVGEEENVELPPSTSLAGKIHKTLMSQVAAGKKHGNINEVDAVKFELKKSEISQLEKMGLASYGERIRKKLWHSLRKHCLPEITLVSQTYSVVRVFDYVTKVLLDFLNRRAFENWNARNEDDLRKQIVSFLDGIKGADKLIEKFKIVRFEQDKVNKDRVWLDIRLTPYFPTKSFVIKLDGHKGDDGNEWDAEMISRTKFPNI